mmetsp:Transcript_1227/g.4118  ORF Transcript_1227/g.4118 Transcript_1227/m.4118 type:complete len:218 (+) Transcript_1227:1811-2464(+)
MARDRFRTHPPPRRLAIAAALEQHPALAEVFLLGVYAGVRLEHLDGTLLRDHPGRFAGCENVGLLGKPHLAELPRPENLDRHQKLPTDLLVEELVWRPLALVPIKRRKDVLLCLTDPGVLLKLNISLLHEALERLGQDLPGALVNLKEVTRWGLIGILCDDRKDLGLSLVGGDGLKGDLLDEELGDRVPSYGVDDTERPWRDDERARVLLHVGPKVV